MMPLRLYLIRHSETEWTFSGQHAGRADIPLTARGEDAGREAGQRLRNISFGHVLTSPLQRAQQTYALAGLGPVPVIEPDLAEWDNSNDEGRTRAEILASRKGSLTILCYEHDRSDQPCDQSLELCHARGLRRQSQPKRG